MSALKTTGLDNAAGIPVGATLTAATWHVAGLYGPGHPHETERDALLTGIALIEERIERHNAAYASLAHGPVSDPPERFSVDLRWRMAYPEGGGIEFTARRTTYADLAEAREHLARIDKYAGVGR